MGLGIVGLQETFMLPAVLDMLYEFGIQGCGGAAPLTPVEDEPGNGVIDKFPVDPHFQHNLHGILVGSPVFIKRE